MNIISREEWGAQPSAAPLIPTPKVREIYLHHSVGSGMVDRDNDGDKGDDYMRQMQTLHMAPPRNWRDIAYNFAIDPIGLEIYEGRGWGVIPGSQNGHNTGTWSVVIMGDFRTTSPSDPLLARIAELVRFGQDIGELPTTPLLGHRDAPGSEDNHCPGGKLYAALPTINQLINEEGGEEMNAAQEAKLDALIAKVDALPASLWRYPQKDDPTVTSTFQMQLRTYLASQNPAATPAQLDAAVAEIIEAMPDDIQVDVNITRE